MCTATSIAVAGFLMSAASTVVSAQAQEAELDRQYNKAAREKVMADQASMARLRADRDALNQKAQLESENAIRENIETQKNTIQDVGEATVQAATYGASGMAVDSLVMDLYRKGDEAQDVQGINATNAQANINAQLASKETEHRYALASNVPERGAGPSGLAMAIDIGSSAVGAATTYKSLSE